MHRVTKRLFGTCSLCLSLLLSADPATAQEPDFSSELPRIPPMTVEEELKSFQLQPGFRAELVAAEPLVKDPVAFAFNGEGHLFVIEMCDYSEQETEHLGSVAKLVDLDHDGRMDKRTTFAEGLSWPTAIWPWKDGVLVAEPPNLLLLRDTDGDGVADKRELWYEGFGRGNVQGLVNSLRWTVDGYIQGATSSSGADLKSGEASAAADPAIALRGRDFVVDPLTHSLKPASGGGQHGMCFNRWGDKFATSNSDHLQQIINLDSWLSTHAVSVPIPSLRKSIAEDGPQAEVYRASPVEPWRIVRTRLRVSGAVPGVVEGGGRAAGYFTGATGTWVFDREAGFGDDQYDTAIVCDVGSNLVHRKRMISKGLFWSGQRIDKESELLRSSDIWFRPVQIGDGPDGALYVADMYREVIEHPKSLPPVIKKHLDLTSGRDKGRIWRVVPTASKVVTAPSATEMPGKLSSAELVQRLDHAVAWQRRTASQLLVERGDASVAPELAKFLEKGTRAEGRLLALHVLNRLGKLDSAALTTALHDAHPRVVAEALRLVGSLKLADKLQGELAAVKSDDPNVQLSLAMTAEALPPTARIELLRKVMATTQEPLTRAVVLVAAGNESPQLFASTSGQVASDDLLKMVLPAWTQMLRSEKSGSQSELRRAISQVITKELSNAGPARTTWTSGLAQLSSRNQADVILGTLDDKSRADFIAFVSSSADAAVAAIEKNPGSRKELPTARWMRLLPGDQLKSMAKKLLDPTTVESLQLIVAESLLWQDADQGVEMLLPELPRMTPVLKRQVLGAILGYSQALSRVADAIESQAISKAEIAPDVRQQLFAVPNKQQSERFKKLLTAASADRAAVIDRYRPALAKIGQEEKQIAAGKMTFQKVCAQCHKLQDMGNDVGPPLKQLADKSPDQLLDIILDPNREVDPKYLGYSVLLSDGRVLSGIIREESAGQIVLAETGGKLHTIARSDIEQLKTTGLSLMPNGLEEQIGPDAMTELIAYLKQAGSSK